MPLQIVRVTVLAAGQVGQAEQVQVAHLETQRLERVPLRGPLLSHCAPCIYPALACLPSRHPLSVPVLHCKWQNKLRTDCGKSTHGGQNQQHLSRGLNSFTRETN